MRFHACIQQLDLICLFAALFCGQFIVPTRGFDLNSYTALVNIAPHYKVVKGSTELKPANLSVDGYPSAGEGCFQSEPEEPNPYLVIDLGETKDIKSVRIVNRDDCCAADLTDFRILLYDTGETPFQRPSAPVCGEETGNLNLGESREYVCSDPDNIQAGLVVIQKNSSGLTLCEVEIMEPANLASIPGIDCTFDDWENPFVDCGLIPNLAAQNWTLGTTKESTPEHTPGNFLYLTSENSSKGDIAEMTTFTFRREFLCVTFWYRRAGPDVPPSLYVSQRNRDVKTENEVWVSDAQVYDIWRRAHFGVYDDLPYFTDRLSFKAVVETANADTSFAIDDITVTKGFCSFITKRVDTIDCDFDDPSGDICDIFQEEKDDADWLWRTADSLIDLPGPPLSSGHYMYLTNIGDTRHAALISPALTGSFPRICVRFRYYMKRSSTLEESGQCLCCNSIDTTVKTSFDRVSKMQNQVSCITTGAMKSSSVLELETVTGLQPLEDRRDARLLA
ncbi:uncharacterized protein LOC143283389 [Babylonia areolata]|uniref:uncharacterized protein LOC143283389 n=1 Tax=Babylonia areolata TaxID=304850 RepID=UPI003FD02BEE